MRHWADANPAPARQAGFTMFELVIVIILVGLLFATAAWRLLPLRGDAESAHVTQTIGTLRSALGLEVTKRILEGSLDSAVELKATNPMALLSRPPVNYIGEIDAAMHDGTLEGHWYFDRASHQLRYRVRYPQYLSSSNRGGPIELSWRVRLRYIDRDGNGEYAGTIDTMRGIELEALDNPQWSAQLDSEGLGP